MSDPSAPSNQHPAYGAVNSTDQTPYPAGGVTTQQPYPGNPTAGPDTPPPEYEYPQPGHVTVGIPSEPPPKYEPPKDGQYPPGVYMQPQQQPPQGYQQTTMQTTTVYQQPHSTVIVADMGWGAIPRTMPCPGCHATITSTIVYKPGALTWLAGGLLCFFGCWLGCCLIPFCMPDLQDIEHRCPNCNRYLGTYSRL